MEAFFFADIFGCEDILFSLVKSDFHASLLREVLLMYLFFAILTLFLNKGFLIA